METDETVLLAVLLIALIFSFCSYLHWLDARDQRAVQEYLREQCEDQADGEVQRGLCYVPSADKLY